MALEVFQHRQRLPLHFAFVKKPSSDDLRTGEDVLHNAESLKDDVLLINRLDTQTHRHVRGEDDGSPFKQYFSALVRLIGSGQDLNQAGFPVAVLSAQPMV